MTGLELLIAAASDKELPVAAHRQLREMAVRLTRQSVREAVASEHREAFYAVANKTDWQPTVGLDRELTFKDRGGEFTGD